LIFLNQSLKLIDLHSIETFASLDSHWRNPKLGNFISLLYVNMWRLISIACLKEETV